MQRCSRSGRRTDPIRSIQLRQNSKAMPKVTVEQIGQAKLPAQPLADRSAGSAFEAGAGLPTDEQNCPPTPLSAKPMKLTRSDRSLIAWTLYFCVLFNVFACGLAHGQTMGLAGQFHGGDFTTEQPVD